MNTTTMRIDHYLHDDPSSAQEIATYIRSMQVQRDGVAQLHSWLQQRFTGEFDHLDAQYIEWDDLARGFLVEVLPLPSEHLPRLVVCLLDAQTALREEFPHISEAGEQVVKVITQWEQEWLALINQSGKSVSRGDILLRCRHAPSSIVLDGLLTLYDALLESARMAGDEPFWNKGGQGEEAREVGARAIESTWWAYAPVFRRWAEQNKFVIRDILAQSASALRAEGERWEVSGLVLQLAARADDLRRAVFLIP